MKNNKSKRHHKFGVITVKTEPIPATTTDRILKLPEIMRTLGISRSTFYRWQKEVADFPPIFRVLGGVGREGVRMMLSDLTAFQQRHRMDMAVRGREHASAR